MLIKTKDEVKKQIDAEFVTVANYSHSISIFFGKKRSNASIKST